MQSVLKKIIHSLLFRKEKPLAKIGLPIMKLVKNKIF